MYAKPTPPLHREIHGREASTAWRYRAFGVHLASAFPLPGMHPAPDWTEPSASIRLGSRSEVDELWPGAEPGAGWRTVFSDGCDYRGELATNGTLRLSYGERAVFLVSPDGRTVLCAPENVEDLAWQRVLLDSVLTTLAVLAGLEPLHASGVEGTGGVVAFLTDSGGGKSSLAAELVRREKLFFCDDILPLEMIGGQVHGHPGPPVMNFPLEPKRFPPAEIGSPLATFGEEAWIAVHHAARRERPLSAVCLLDRRTGQTLGLDRLAPTPLHLLPYLVARRVPKEWLARRFELLSELTASVPVYRLSADISAEPARLADLVQDRLFEAGLG
ncbi:MAG: hypothetical protein M3396_03630 [Actinomycetota bacterium]|nr:hypothetical protein [Actinomycetota bacterium]